MFKLVLGWTAVLVAIVFVAQKFWMDDSETRKSPQSSSPSTEVESAEDVELLREAAPFCNETLSGFLNAGTPEQRNQFVSSPITTVVRMSRYYSMNPFGEIDPATISLTGSSVVHLPEGNAIETQLSSTNGQLLDVLFVRDDEDWKIDWDHFARYSDAPWALFLAESGEGEGEFRLLARERLADERKEEDSMSLVLYAPRFGYTGDTGFQSPEFLVKRDSRNGRLLEAAFELERTGKRAFGVKLPSIDPEGLIRVRVKIRRTESELRRKFEITDVIACHWYSSDDPGVEISSPEAPASSPEAVPSPETTAETPAPPGE